MLFHCVVRIAEFNIEHCVKKYHWIHYGTLNIFLFESRALSACCSGSLIFAGCGTHTPDQSTAYMQGTAQADSAFYLQQMQQSSDDTRINWQLLAIRALVKEGKTGQAVELFNQLPQELNDSQRREKTLLAVEINWRRKICWRAKLAGENHTCRFRTKPASALLAGKNRCQPGVSSN